MSHPSALRGSAIRRSDFNDSPINYYSDRLKEYFGTRVQKISIHLGQSCPNRRPDGSGGCNYCNPLSFLPPSADRDLNPSAQFHSGVARFAGKYPDQVYLAYIQGYTGTLGRPSRLENWYRALLDDPHCAGLVIGTRPDCLPLGVLELLGRLQVEYGKMLRIELGVESFDDRLLNLANRRCNADRSRTAIRELHSLNIPVDIHLILGLPGSEDAEDPAAIAAEVSILPVSMVKFHQFQIISGSYWGDVWEGRADGGQVTRDSLRAGMLSVDRYADKIIALLRRLAPDVMIGRLAADAPPEMIRAHESWNNMKNYRFTRLIENQMREHSLRQGMDFSVT